MNTWFISILLMLSSLGGIVHIPQAPNVFDAVMEIKTLYPDWEKSYKANEFDCSNMSALVYEYLKCEGFQSEIKCGINSNNIGHAWVECNGKIIECTNLTVINNYSWYNQFNPNKYKPSYFKSEEWDFIHNKYFLNIVNQY